MVLADVASIEDVILADVVSRVSPARYAELDLRSNIRKENIARVEKRKNNLCPYCTYCDEGNFCLEKKIRCAEGGTVLDGVRKCNYDPLGDKHFLIVHTDPGMRNVLSTFLQCFGVAENRIDLAFSYPNVEAVLKQSAAENKQYALAISGMELSERRYGNKPIIRNGYQFVNLLLERNCNARIWLIAELGPDIPANYMGDMEIIPGQKAVSAFILNKDFCYKTLEKEYNAAMNSFVKK